MASVNENICVISADRDIADIDIGQCNIKMTACTFWKRKSY